MSKIRRHTAAFVIGGLMVILGLSLWDSSAPVVWFVHGDIVTHDENSIRIDVSGVKVRDCRRIPGSEVGYVQSVDDRWHESEFIYVDDLTPYSSMPSSWFRRLSFGVWEWGKYIGPVTHTMITIEHDCGNGIDRESMITTRMGPFPL